MSTNSNINPPKNNPVPVSPNYGISADPNYYVTSATTCASTFMPSISSIDWGSGGTLSLERIKCPLPEDALERLLALGIASNKEALKKKLLESYKEWCKTQTVPVSILPILMIVGLLSMGVEFDKELEKEREKISEKEE